ncbi:MAG: response regulator, partial [Lentisphaerae bacterium]|nr:response regulator [Lentisphaerota bacterium]
RWIVPLEGNEAVQGLNLASEDRVRVALEAARDRRDVAVIRAGGLMAGDEGFLVCVPICRGEVFGGFILGSFRTEELLDTILHEVAAYDCSVVVSEGDRKIYSHSDVDGHDDKRLGQESEISLHGVTWRTRIRPNQALLNEVRSAIPEVALAAVSLVAALLALTTRLAQDVRRHARAAEEQLREHRDRLAELVEERTSQLQAVMDNVQAAIFMKDTEGRHLLVNRHYAETSGVRSEDMVGETDSGIFPEAGGDRMTRVDREVMSTGEVRTVEEEMPQPDGTRRFFQTTKVPLFDGSGNVLGMCSLATDITERKRIESAMAAAAEEWQTTFDTIGDMVALLDRDRRVLRCNQAMREFLGAPDDEIRGQRCGKLMHGAAGIPEECPFTRMLKTRRQETMLLAVGERSMEVTVHPILGNDGEVTGAVHVVRDVTEQREAADRLREGEQKYYSLIDNIAGMVYRAQRDWSVEFAFGTEALCGYAPDSLASGGDVTWSDLIHPEDRDRVFEDAVQPSEEPGALTQKYRIICKGGSVRWVEDHKTSRLADDGAFLGVDGVVFDVTERQEMEEQLVVARGTAEEASRAKSAFVANMSHEIRTPLNAIIGLTSLVLKTDLSPRQRDYLSKISGASHALLAIVNDILDFSKIEAGKLTLESVEFGLESVTRQLFDVFGLQAQQKGLELFFNIDSDVPPTLVGDPTRLRQVLTNLLSNAIKFTESGQVAVSARLVDAELNRTMVEFAVSDTGVGISNGHLSKLFHAFSQADSSTTRRFGGTGLGLVICRQLVNLMGGEIRVESQSAEGSTFTFTVGFAKPAHKNTKRLEVGPELRGLRVLIVDDDEATRDLLVHRLRAYGVSPSAASSVEDAITVLHQAAAETPYELLLVDWSMPQADGLTLCDRIRKDGSPQPTPRMILMSGYWNHGLATCVDEGRVDAFLLKPFTASTLFETILRVLADRLTVGRAPSEGEAVEPGVPDLRHARILLAEDNELNQEVALGLLAETGCEVRVARNGREAVEAVALQTFDLVLMDIQMPEMDGYEATRRIRDWEEEQGADVGCQVSGEEAEETPEGTPPSTVPTLPSIPSHLPIIAMTADAMKEDRDRALATGMDDHVAKPVDPDELYRVLARWTGSRQQQGEEQDTPGRTATEAKTWEAQLRELDVVDVDAALAPFRGDAKRLRAFLRKFAESQASAAEDIRAALEAGDTEAAQRLAHTLKGLAGTIGAERLREASREVEVALEDGGADDACSLLPALEQRLQEVLDSLLRLAPEPDSAPAAGEETEQPVSPEELAPLLSRLAALLEEHDPTALQCAQDLASRPMPRSVSTVVRHLSKLVGRYAFKEAQAELRDLAESIEVDLSPGKDE